MLIPKILIISIAAGLFAQGLKLILRVIKEKKISWREWNDYGGMPSAHASFLTALCTAVALKEGVTSTAFAVSIIVSVILIRDAMGIRMYLENHGKVLVQLIKKQSKEEQVKIKNFDHALGERIGHTYSEIYAGALIGFIFAWLFYPLL
jgi:acid phosphatase family membrane protein YuiD